MEKQRAASNLKCTCLYDILIIDPPANDEPLDECRLNFNYRFLMVRVHPDKNPHPEATNAATLLNKAILVLRVSTTEKKYRKVGIDRTNIMTIHNCEAFVNAIRYARYTWTAAFGPRAGAHSPTANPEQFEQTSPNSVESINTQFQELVLAVIRRQALSEEHSLVVLTQARQALPELRVSCGSQDLETIAAFASISLETGQENTLESGRDSSQIEVITLVSDDDGSCTQERAEVDELLCAQPRPNAWQNADTSDDRDDENRDNVASNANSGEHSTEIACIKHGTNCREKCLGSWRRRTGFHLGVNNFQNLINKYSIDFVVNHKPRSKTKGMFFLVQWKAGYTGRTWVRDGELLAAPAARCSLLTYLDRLPCRRFALLWEKIPALEHLEGIHSIMGNQQG